MFKSLFYLDAAEFAAFCEVKVGFWAVPTLRAAAWAFLPSHEVHFVAEPGLLPVERLKMGCRWGTDEELMSSHLCAELDRRGLWQGGMTEIWQNQVLILIIQHWANFAGMWWDSVHYFGSCSSAWVHQIEQSALNHLQNNLQIGYQLHSPVEMVISHGSPAHSWQWVVPKFTQNTRKSLRKQRKPKYSGIFRFWGHRHIRLYSCTTPYETCCW